MSLSKSKCWYSNNCLHFLKCVVQLLCIAYSDVNSYSLYSDAADDATVYDFVFDRLRSIRQGVDVV